MMATLQYRPSNAWTSTLDLFYSKAEQVDTANQFEVHIGDFNGGFDRLGAHSLSTGHLVDEGRRGNRCAEAIENGSHDLGERPALAVQSRGGDPAALVVREDVRVRRHEGSHGGEPDAGARQFVRKLAELDRCLHFGKFFEDQTVGVRTRDGFFWFY